MGTKRCVALGALPLAGLITAPHTLEAENVEALGKDCILLAGVTAGTGQPRLGQAKASLVTIWTVSTPHNDIRKWYMLS